MEEPIPRRRGGQPGNRNAVKHGLRTAEMNALRAEVRLAVQKAKALAAAAWSAELSRGLTLAGVGAGLACHAEIAGSPRRVGQSEAFGG
ncbi:MAG TPA: hypothetical protein VLC74_07340, partial [Rhizomicrobium sp.]|nr:hypothetical protein [Rhizomicrobium sp.]